MTEQINEDDTLTVNLFDYMINVDNIGDYIEPVDYEIVASGNNGNCLVDEYGLMTYILLKIFHLLLNLLNQMMIYALKSVMSFTSQMNH